MKLFHLQKIMRIALALVLFVTLPAYAWKMEAGKVNLSSTSGLTQLQSHTFQQIYDTPPIVIALPTTAGSDASAIRISNVTTTGFRMSSVEPRSEDGPHASMTVSYIAIEAGTHTFPNGEVIEAGILTTDKMQFNGNPNGRKQWETLTFANTFSSPVILADIQTIANETNTIPSSPSHPWMTVAIDSITNTQANLSLERSEVYDRITGSNYQFENLSTSENIGYVVMSRGLLGNFRATGNVLINFETLYASNSVNGWSNGCNSINFAGSYSASPIVVANKATRREADGGWLRECSVNSSRIQLTIDEDDAQDSERSHGLEDAGLLIFSESFYYDSNAPTTLTTSNHLLMETGVADLSPSQFTTITFKQVYDLPPAVFLLEDNQNPEPSSVRIRNVTTESFQVVPVEPDSRVADAADQTSRVHYLAITKGQFNFPDGKAIEVGPVVPPKEITNFQGKNVSGSSWFNFNFSTLFGSTPTFLSFIQSMNSEPAHTPGAASRPWMTTASRNITSSGGQIALDRAETSTGTLSAAEEIAYLATTPGILSPFKSVLGNTISSEAQVTPDSVAGTLNCYNYNFLQTYPAAPLVVGSQMSWDGGDGGWLRRCSNTNTSVSLKIEEDWAADTDNSHTTEVAGFMAFSEPFYVDFSLVANYQLEGPAWNGTPGEVIDSSNSGLNGRIYGDARAYPAQVCNGALFDGSGDYIEIADNPALDISNELTVMAWVKVNARPTSDLKTIVSKDTNFEFHIDTAGRILWWWNNSSGASRSFTSSTSLTNGTWHHVAITYSRSAGTQKIYIDGVERGSRSYANESLINNNLPLFIGTDYNYRSRDFNGSIDEVKVFKRSLAARAIQKHAAETRPCASCVLRRFDIIQPTYTLACPDTRAEIDITARCVDGSIKTDYSGTVNLSAPAGASFFDASTGGNAITSLSYNFADSGNKKAYLYFNNEQSNVQVTANDTSAGVSNTATTGTNFNAFGFRVSQQPNHFICGNSTSMTLQAYGRTNNSPSQSCEVLTGFSGNKTLDAWFRATTNDDAVQDIVSHNLNVAGTAISAQNTSADNNLNLTFTNGSSTFNLAYPNTAKIMDLNFRLDSAPYDGVTFSPMTASTNNFVAYPQRIAINAQTGSTTLNGNSNTSSTTHKAGQNFNLTLTAQCSDGSTATDFQPTQSTTGIMAYLQRTGPIGGSSVNGTMPISGAKTLTSNPSTSIVWENSGLAAGNFTNGVYNYAGANYSEVGLTRLHIEGRNYFNQDIASTQMDIGRFIPDRFNVITNDGVLSPYCTIGANPDFSYIGQEIAYTATPNLTIRALNTGGDITQNYTEPGYIKLTTANSDISRTFPNSDTTKFGLDGLTKMALTVAQTTPSAFTSASNGVLVYNFETTDRFTYTRNANSLVAPFNSDIDVVINNIVDGDGVGSDAEPYTLSPAAIELRYGRWVMDAAYGPETQALTIPMRIEHWNGSNFSVNDSENCATYNASTITVTPSLSGGSTTLSGSGTLILGKAPLGSQISLSAPGPNNVGTVNLEFLVDSWLRFDWDNNPLTADTNPSTVASFGQYRGHDRIIYWREINN